MRARARIAGTTLVEVLVTLLVVSIVLGVIAILCKEYADILRFASEKDRAMAGAQEAVERVKAEVAGAVELLEPVPGSGTEVQELEFTRVNPTLTARLPQPTPSPSPTALPSPSPAPYDPHHEEYLVTVRYYVSPADGTLLRQATFADGQSYTHTVAGGVAGFAVKSPSDDLLEIRTSFRSTFRGEELIKPLMTRVRLRNKR